MSLLKIIANDIEIDFVKETLNIKKENNAMIRNFTVSHSSYPFLIIENEKAVLALGTREITSVNKKKTVTVKVFENDIEFVGELQIISYLKGYRKGNLKFASPLLQIMNNKIGAFMPRVSVTGATSGFPAFSETGTTIVTGDADWPEYVSNFIQNGWPTVKWNFPMMNWKNLFGENLASDDDWFEYKNFVNAFDDNGNYLLNTAVEEEDLSFTITNVNVPMPQVYLLAPLFYALQSIGFTMKGDFTTNTLIQKIMLLSFKNNLCKVTPTLPDEIITLPALTEWVDPTYNISSFSFTAATAGTYIVSYRFVEPQYASPAGTFKSFKVKFDGATSGYLHQRGKNATTYEEAVQIVVSESQVGLPISFVYLTPASSLPDYDITISLETQNDFHQMHPTIELGRYCPDWTFATYLNNIKNFFNLDIDPDDATKKLILNFNEDWIVNQLPEILNKSMAIKSYDQTPYEAFLLKYDNDEDTAIWITNLGVEIYDNQKSDFLQNLDTKFKYVPINNITAELSSDLEDKGGTGLLIYDETYYPNISPIFEDKNLKINGTGGIYDTFWKKWLKFRLNASIFEVEAGFTKTEIGKFIKTKRIYFDHQDFVVASVDYKKLNGEKYIVTFKLESVNI